jgi:hypothetical protein
MHLVQQAGARLSDWALPRPTPGASLAKSGLPRIQGKLIPPQPEQHRQRLQELGTYTVLAFFGGSTDYTFA